MNPDFIKAFNDKALEVNRALNDHYFSVVGPYVDMVLIGDDYATQTGPYFDLGLFRTLYKEHFREYIASIRKHCPHALIAHHCCGSSYDLIAELVDIGVQVSNPTQTRAVNMQPEKLAPRKNEVGFHGGGDLQHILPHGTQQEVEDFTRDLITKLAPGGGFVLAPCHTLPDDVKPENLVTFLETARSMWGYPIGSTISAEKCI